MPGSQNILILEDHTGLGQMIKDVFEFGGFSATVVTNGRKGLEEAQKGGWAAIISDLKMPEMDGITFLKALNEHPPAKKNGPIIVYSNFAYEYSKDYVLSLGAKDFIAKDTLGTTELLDRVKKLMSS